MAYYNRDHSDTYNGPHPSARRHDPYTRPQNPNYASNTAPVAGRPGSSSHRNGGEDIHGGLGSRPTYVPYGQYDYRTSFPPPPPPDTGRPQRPPPSPTSRRRYTWPPQPTCEDERISVAKEANSRKLLREINSNEVPSRGTIDQDPIIQEVPELINRDERRFVVLSGSEEGSRSSGVLTPPTSEDERARKIKRRPSRLDTDLKPIVPELSRRTASPYTITQPTRLPRVTSQIDRFLSPNSLTPPATDLGRRRDHVDSRSKPTSPGRNSVRHSPSARSSNDYFSARRSRDDHAIDDDDWAEYAPGSRRTSARSTTSSVMPGSSPRTSTQDFAPSPSNALPLRRANLDTRRNTDTSSTLPRLEVDKTRRPPPLAPSNTLDSASFSTSSTLKAGDFNAPRPLGSYISSRAISPASANSRASPSPPRSPRLSADYSSQYTTDRSSNSRPASSSGSSSRPSSPAPQIPGDSPRLPRVDVDWSTLQRAVQRTKPPSRLASSMRQESLPDVHITSRTYLPACRPRVDLPYPEDDGPGTPSAYMPAESSYQYFSTSRTDSGLSSSHDTTPVSRDMSPAPSNVFRRSERSSRPALPTRHSVATVSPTEERSHPMPRTNSFATTTQIERELATLERKRLPECRRVASALAHDDWYTVNGAPDLHFCPDCVGVVFDRTVFRQGIRRMPPRIGGDINDEIQCALGSSKWIRLAWLLTLKQKRTDLTLLRHISEIEEEGQACPGKHGAVRSWYGLKDSEGSFIRRFFICPGDVRKIVLLLPTLSGMFVPRPHRASYDEGQCALYAQSNRFSTYLDALTTIHEHARATRRAPDPTDFVLLVKHKLQLRTCEEDRVIPNIPWHFVPGLPDLTVCEDCYEDVIEPKIKEGSEVAKRFNRTLQPVYGEGAGCSCQLYSPRMRKVFEAAVKENDFSALMYVAQARQSKKAELQAELQRKFRRLGRDRNGEVIESELRIFHSDRKDIMREWKDDWE